MTRPAKILERVLGGRADASIRFQDMCPLLRRLGFTERVRGGHWIYARDGVVEIINIQPKGALAKPYQVRQVRELIVKYRLGDGQ